jgi:hypothetical protein
MSRSSRSIPLTPALSPVGTGIAYGFNALVFLTVTPAKEDEG